MAVMRSRSLKSKPVVFSASAVSAASGLINYNETHQWAAPHLHILSLPWAAWFILRPQRSVPSPLSHVCPERERSALFFLGGLGLELERGQALFKHICPFHCDVCIAVDYSIHILSVMCMCMFLSGLGSSVPPGHSTATKTGCERARSLHTKYVVVVYERTMNPSRIFW